MKVGVPAETEREGATVTPTLGRLKTRPVQVSSSSDSTATPPLGSTAVGARLVGGKVGATDDEGARGVERLASVATALFRQEVGRFLFLVFTETHICVKATSQCGNE